MSIEKNLMLKYSLNWHICPKDMKLYMALQVLNIAPLHLLLIPLREMKEYN
jgi:hypothetical protein